MQNFPDMFGLELTGLSKDDGMAQGAEEHEGSLTTNVEVSGTDS